MSQSMHSTFSPCFAKEVATAAQTEVFPVPPLPDRKAINSPNCATSSHNLESLYCNIAQITRGNCKFFAVFSSQ
jgi:hypothetical protein